MKCVVTTINLPSKAIEKLQSIFGNNLIVVGDKKTPVDWHYKNVEYIPYQKTELFDHYAPDNHYARKNLGYIEAIKQKAELIYDTDDDNIPNENWKAREINCEAKVSHKNGWLNVYKIFSREYVWPRGFSLKELSKYQYPELIGIKNVVSPIQQGLANGEADVDAIWRLTQQFKSFQIDFDSAGSAMLTEGSWCPFNSQTTWWFPQAYPLLYLPVYASFRMTDIWRSFVAQRCIWALGHGVTFHSPAEVYQERNEHDLLKDFEDEIPGYLHNDKIVEILTSLELKTGSENIFGNMIKCYQAIIDNKILPEMEMRSLMSWIKDVNEIWRP